jgi:hypothetical protein
VKHGLKPSSSQTQLTFAPTGIATAAASSLTVSGDIVEVGETHAAHTAANPHATTSTTARAPTSAAQHAIATDCKEDLEGNRLPSSSSLAVSINPALSPALSGSSALPASVDAALSFLARLEGPHTPGLGCSPTSEEAMEVSTAETQESDTADDLRMATVPKRARGDADAVPQSSLLSHSSHPPGGGRPRTADDGESDQAGQEKPRSAVGKRPRREPSQAASATPATTTAALPTARPISVPAIGPSPPAPTPPIMSTSSPAASSYPDDQSIRSQLAVALAALAEAKQLIAQLCGQLQQRECPQTKPPAQLSMVDQALALPSALPRPCVQPGTLLPLPASAAASPATAPPAVHASRPHAHRDLRHHPIEPSAAMQRELQLPLHSTTDLIATVQYAALSHGSMSRRIWFPDHATRALDHRLEVAKQLQKAEGLQIAPPLIPTFLLAVTALDHQNLEQLAGMLPDRSPKALLVAMLQRQLDAGDAVDPLQHSLPRADCVENWSQLLTPSTQAYKPKPGADGLMVVIQLGFRHPWVVETVRNAFTVHAQRQAEQLAGNASRPHSPSSTASTVESTDGDNSPAPSPRAHTASSSASSSSAPARLNRPALHSVVTLSPHHVRYVCATVSNWPREHPTELCGGNDQLRAFLQQRAPDLHLVLTEEYGSTSPTTTVVCERQHLPQLQALQGTLSAEQGISRPLSLNCTVRLLGAQTCTHCWQPNHGAARCPRQSYAPKPVLPTSHLPACRLCYSFEHHTATCRVPPHTVTCTLCNQLGHATATCVHFRPSTRSLKDFLSPRQTPAQLLRINQQPAAPILSSGQLSSARPWQQPSPQAVAAPVPVVAPPSSSSFSKEEVLALLAARDSKMDLLLQQLAMLTSGLIASGALVAPALPMAVESL